MGNITKWVGASLLAVVVMAGVSGCKKKVEGPKPAPEAVSPKTVCSEQLSTWATVSGSGFSPSPKDGLTDNPKLALPQLTITKTRVLNGTAAPRPPVVLNADVTDPTVSRVMWTSQSEMSFLVDQTPPLDSGIYDLSAKNPTGGEGMLTDALVVVPPPMLQSVEPAEICASPLETTITLTGTGFLFLEGAAPAVTVTAGASTVNAASVTMVDGACNAIYSLSNSYTCTQITVSLGAGTVAGDGVYTVSLTNPATANCTSLTTVEFIVVPPPVVSAVAPEEICSAQLETEITLTGTGFLVRDGEMPTVTMTGGATSVNATAVAMVDGACQLFHGLTNWYVCTGITATLAAGSVV
ncbi:MAG: IPT/TIG domain-containing protein, partial [Deltaproteobacteria bacterium]|nr:IPT/TIG domain-containing protein [Deltaproteobacteria bacterium]